jgi:hypothetical protein
LPEPSPGEIDSLAIFLQNHEIYLIDEKDSQIAGVPTEISTLKNRYTRKKGYVEKINKKRAFVEKYLEQILAYYKIDKRGNSWNVICIFVTSNVSFLNLNNVIIMSIDEFKKFLDKYILNE